MTEIFYHPWTHRFLVRAASADDATVATLASQIETERARIDTLQTSKDADVTSLHGKIDVNHTVAMGTITAVNASVVSLETLTSGFATDIAQIQADIVSL
jgi:hypothetical protein